MLNLKTTFGILVLCGFFSCSGGGQEDASNEAENRLDAFDEKVVEDLSGYADSGKSIAQASFAALSSQLMAAMQEGGVKKAIDYCHIAAMPLTDSLSEAHNASIRRVSLRYRNPQNQPDSLEVDLLHQWTAMAEKGEAIKPMVTRISENQVQFNAPINMKALCLNCHGMVGAQVQEEDYKLIKERYPDDMAIDFQDGDLRGMWSIRFFVEQKL